MYIILRVTVFSVPVHGGIILPLIVYNNDEQVYVAACSAIYHIMSSPHCNGVCFYVVSVYGNHVCYRCSVGGAS